MNIKVPALDKARVLVVGDAMLDRYWHGRTDRISAEAPVPVVAISEVDNRPGGAANVALNLVSLGSTCSLVAVIGDDDEGRLLRTKLESAEINCGLITAKDYRTITKLRIVSQNQQLVRADFESELDLDINDLMNSISKFLPDKDILVMSDYDKGVLDDPQRIIKKSQQVDVPVLVDPKFKDFELYRGAMLLKPNKLELEKAVGYWHSEREMISKCEDLMQRLHLKALLVTRSSQGMTLLQPGMEEVHFPAHRREVSDVSGAGDTVIAILSAAMRSSPRKTDLQS